MGDSVEKIRHTEPKLIPAKIAKVLVAIQKDLEPLKRSSTNLEYGSKFVPLPEVVTKAISLLNSHKIAVVQPPVTDEREHLAIKTILIHESGVGWAETTRLALGKADPQGHASAITYMRRYQLMSMLGMTSEDDDDDGNKAAGVFVKVGDDQIARIKSLLTQLRYPQDRIAAEVWNIKTADHAALAIINFEKIISMRVRDHEAKDRATKIEVGSDGTSDGEPQTTTGLAQRIANLGLKVSESKFVFSLTGKPFLKNCTAEELAELATILDKVESGKRGLPDEWYAAGAAADEQSDLADDDDKEDKSSGEQQDATT